MGTGSCCPDSLRICVRCIVLSHHAPHTVAIQVSFPQSTELDYTVQANQLCTSHFPRPKFLKVTITGKLRSLFFFWILSWTPSTHTQCGTSGDPYGNHCSTRGKTSCDALPPVSLLRCTGGDAGQKAGTSSQKVAGSGDINLLLNPTLQPQR